MTAIRKPVPSLALWNALQAIEALSAKNRWHAAQKLGREAITDEELFEHYNKNGGSENFAKTHIQSWIKANK